MELETPSYDLEMDLETPSYSLETSIPVFTEWLLAPAQTRKACRKIMMKREISVEFQLFDLKFGPPKFFGVFKVIFVGRTSEIGLRTH